MRALLVIIAIFFLAAQCQDEAIGQPEPKIPDFKTVKIDSCQYLFYERGNEGYGGYVIVLTHKGNCNNSIHNKQQQ